MTEPPAFQLYAADFYMDTVEWTAAQVGIYFRLLMYEWVNGAIPDDEKKLARIAGTDLGNFKKCYLQDIAKKFTSNGGGELINVRLEETREKQRKYRELQKQKGIEGAKARWGDDSHGHTHGHSRSNGRKIALQSSSSLKKEKDMQVSPALLFPLKDGTDYPLELAKISQYEKTYGSKIDVMFELKECLQWDIDRPKQRKTKTGILGHINFWLNRAVKDKGPGLQPGIEHDGSAVEEARKDRENYDPEKTKANIERINKMGLTATREVP